MIIGVLTLELSIPAYSLKDKRQVLRSLQARLRNELQRLQLRASNAADRR